MKSHKLTFIDGLNRELKNKLKDFNDYLVSISTALKTLDKIKTSENVLIDFKQIINQEQFLLFKLNEIAWTENVEEWKKFSIFTNKKIEEKIRVTAISHSLKKIHEVIPPFSVHEVSIFTRIGQEEKNINEYRFKIDFFRENETLSKINKLQVVFDIVTEFLEKSHNYNSGEKNILLTDIPFSNIDFINLNVNEKNKAFELAQNFLVELKSLNIIPVSLVKINGAPLIPYLLKILEHFYGKEELNKVKIEILNDKIYLADKLRIKARSPVFDYTNTILENPYIKEKCYIFYLRCDHDHIQRVEIPQFALNHVELIHNVLVEEYSLSKKKLKMKGFYSYNMATRGLIIEKMKKEEIIKIFDLLIKDQMIKNYGKKIGLISNFT